MNAPAEDHRPGIVLNAFDTPFNKRDYVAAERFRWPRYIQHSAHIPPGRDGLFGLVKDWPATFAPREPFGGGDRRFHHSARQEIGRAHV